MVLFRFRHETNSVRVWKISCFGLKYLLWSPQQVDWLHLKKIIFMHSLWFKDNMAAGANKYIRILVDCIWIYCPALNNNKTVLCLGNRMTAEWINVQTSGNDPPVSQSSSSFSLLLVPAPEQHLMEMRTSSEINTSWKQIHPRHTHLPTYTTTGHLPVPVRFKTRTAFRAPGTLRF